MFLTSTLGRAGQRNPDPQRDQSPPVAGDRRRDQPADKQFSGAVTVMGVNGPDIKAENDFNTTRVRTVQRSASAQGKSLVYSFPAHSFTMLQAKLA